MDSESSSTPKEKVTVLLSGGLDSSVALHWAVKHYNVPLALSFDYGSKHASHELECAAWQAESLGIEHRIIDIRPISAHLKSALLENGGDIPNGCYQDDNMHQTVVPFRNGIFLAIAAGIAESHDCGNLVIAAHSGDHSIYPDCREDFMSAMTQAISVGTYAAISIIRPFIHMGKDEIVRLGNEFDMDFSHTYSCYKGGPLHCGTCATCLERKDAFLSSGIIDPTAYLQ